MFINGLMDAYMKANTRKIRGRGWERSLGLTGDSTLDSGPRGKCTEKECLLICKATGPMAYGMKDRKSTTQKEEMPKSLRRQTK